MAKHENLIKLESLISNAQNEFLKCGSSSLLIKSNNKSHQRFCRIAKYQVNGDFCDVTLVSADKVSFKAHKLILASATDYFDAMFSCPLRESSQSEVELPSLDGIALRRLLDFVYLGEVDLTANSLPLWLDIGSLYQFPSLLDECAAFMSSHLSLANAAYLFSLADRYSLESVRDALAELVRRNFHNFVNDQRELFLALPATFWIAFLKSNERAISEERLAHAMLLWLEQNNADMALSHKLLSHLRFGTINSLALNHLLEAILSFRTRISNAPASATPNTAADVSLQQRSINQLIAALRHFCSMFAVAMQDSSSLMMATSSEFAGSSLSPIGHLLSLNPDTFRPRGSLPGVVSIQKNEPGLYTFYYKLIQIEDNVDQKRHSAADSSHVHNHPHSNTRSASHSGTGRGQSLAGTSTDSSAETPKYQLACHYLPEILIRTQLTDEFDLISVSYSCALNAVFFLYWHDSSDIESLNGDVCEPQKWAALDGNNFHTAATMYFLDKMTICFSSGRDLLAVPRKDGTLVMLHDRAYLFCGLSTLSSDVDMYPDVMLEFCVHTRRWCRVPVYFRIGMPSTTTASEVEFSWRQKDNAIPATSLNEESGVVLSTNENTLKSQFGSQEQDVLLQQLNGDCADDAGAPASSHVERAARESDQLDTCLCASSGHFIVRALMGIGVAAAADELQQIVYISGQMQCCVSSSSTGSIFKNSCYRLKLVSTTALYSQSSKRAKFSEESLWDAQLYGSSSLTTNHGVIPLSAKMDLSSLPMSDSFFILEELPLMNVAREKHQLLHYRSSVGGFELLIAIGGSIQSAEPNAASSVEFLDLQRPSLGWILVDTDPNFFICDKEVCHKFVLAGDSIIAFGHRFQTARSRSVHAFDLRYLTNQYSEQVLIREQNSSNLSGASMTDTTKRDERPIKLSLDFNLLWRRQGGFEDEGSFTYRLFFPFRLPPLKN